jgi:hypothetical protein
MDINAIDHSRPRCEHFTFDADDVVVVVAVMPLPLSLPILKKRVCQQLLTIFVYLFRYDSAGRVN